MSDEQDPLASGRMTLWEHIAELRSRLIKAMLAVVVGAVVGWIVYPYVVSFLVQPFQEVKPGATLIATSLTEGFATRIEASVYMGIILAMPVILWQVWRFVTPGLYPHEKRYAVPFVASALVLFALGAFIAYRTLPAAIGFLVEVSGFDIEILPTIDSYLKLNLFMMLAFGVGMEFPVLLVGLQLVGILNPRQLLGWWRMALVVIVIVAAVITPSADPISMLALAIPMVVLYFVAIGIGALVARRRRKQEAKAAVSSA